jgi:hypothetical protein
MCLSVDDRGFGSLPVVCGRLSRDVTGPASVGTTDFLEGELNGALKLGICEVTRTAVAWAVHTCRMTVSFIAVERVEVRVAVTMDGKIEIPFLRLFLQFTVAPFADSNRLSYAEVRKWYGFG